MRTRLGIALLTEKLQRLTTLIMSMVGKGYLGELNCHILNTGFRERRREINHKRKRRMRIRESMGKGWIDGRSLPRNLPIPQL